MAGWEGTERVKVSLEDTRLLLCEGVGRGEERGEGGGGGEGECRIGREIQGYFCSCNGTVTYTPCNKCLISKLFFFSF